MKIIFFDTESTGLRDGQICQLACLLWEDRALTARNLFFQVDDMNPEAQRIHGLSREALAVLSGGIRFSDRAEELLSLFSGADVIVGHNVSADLKALRAEFARLSVSLPPVKSFCTMNFFTPVTRIRHPYHAARFKPPRLEELAAHYGLLPDFIARIAASLFGESGAAHDARYDVAATYLALREAARLGVLGSALPGFE